jgi:hypothetical protein
VPATMARRRCRRHRIDATSWWSITATSCRIRSATSSG